MTRQEKLLNIFEKRVDAGRDVIDLFDLAVNDVVVNYELSNGKKIDFRVKKILDKDTPVLLIDILKSNDNKIHPNKNYEFDGEVDNG